MELISKNLDDKIVFRKYIADAAKYGVINDSIFAADLSKVDEIEAHDFFDRTEMVENLRELLENVIRRVMGKSDRGAYLIDTVMGGGKSHSLVYIALVFKKPSAAIARSEIESIVKNWERDSIPQAEVVIFDGMVADARVKLIEQPTLSKYFSQGLGKDQVKRSIEEERKPVVFLFDEILTYLAKREDYWEADVANLRTLIEAVADTKQSIIIITLANNSVNQRGYDRMKSIFGEIKRVGSIRMPQDPTNDFAKIARKQIFEKIDPNLARKAAEKAIEILARDGIPAEKELYVNSYPFHPFLIELLTKRFPEFESFQRTREALRILAKACASLLRNNKLDLLFIGPGDIDLSDKDVRSELTSSSNFEMNNLNQIVKSDIISEENTDRELTRLLTSIYTYSLHPKKEKRGMNAKELFNSILPEVGSSEDIERKIKDYIEKKASYLELNTENNKFYFSEEINIRARIRQEMQHVGDITNEFYKIIEDLTEATDKTLLSLVYNGDAGVAFGKANIIFAPYKISRDKVEEYIDQKKLFTSSSQAPNSVIVIYPNAGKVKELENYVKQQKAVDMLLKQYARNKEIIDRLRDISQEITNNLFNRFFETYREVVYLQSHEKVWEHLNYMTDKDTYIKGIISKLEENNKLYLDARKINLDKLFEKLIGNRPYIRFSDAYDNIATSSTLPFLPKTVFTDAVKLALDKKIIGISEDKEPLTPLESSAQLPNSMDNYLILSREKAIELKKEMARRKAAVEAENPEINAGRLPEQDATGTGITPPEVTGKAERKSDVSSVPEERTETFSEKATAEQANSLINLLIKAEYAWRPLSNRDQNSYLVIEVKGTNGNVNLKAPMSKVSKVRTLIEALRDIMDKNTEISLDITLNEEAAAKLRGSTDSSKR